MHHPGFSIRRAFIVALVFSAAAVSAFAQGRGGEGMQRAAFDPHNLSGYWELPFDGRSIPPSQLAPSVSKAALEEKAAHDQRTIRYCMSMGLQFAMDPGRPLNIRQGSREIVIVPEGLASARHLYLDGRKQVDLKVFDLSTVGNSIAHWDGDTLVVDTIGMDGNKGILAIPGGGFRTDDSHLVERYRLLKNGSVLSVTFTWTDPKVFAQPHSYEFRYFRMSEKYEPVPAGSCDPWDDDRTAFISAHPISVIH